MSVEFRQQLGPSDPTSIAALTRDTGFFSDEEVAIAQDLALETLTKGETTSGYHFVVVDAGTEQPGAIAAYACFGPIPGTQSSYDLYWIVVHHNRQGSGLGRAILTEVERQVVERGGRRLYADTSSRRQYEPTRAFYARCGYVQAAFLEDFYATNDGKVIFAKILQ